MTADELLDESRKFLELAELARAGGDLVAWVARVSAAADCLALAREFNRADEAIADLNKRCE